MIKETSNDKNVEDNVSNNEHSELQELLNCVNAEKDNCKEECDLLFDLIVQNQYRLLSSSKAFQVTKKNIGNAPDNLNSNQTTTGRGGNGAPFNI